VTRPIVFLTDYGLRDEFVGICHGVIARIAPDAAVIDLTHSIARQDVMRGALALSRAAGYMPADAVYCAVVDPGVGSERRPVAVRAASGAVLVGPDNGLLSMAWEVLGGAGAAFEIASPGIVLSPMSKTFHGRDVFAPAAAALARGSPVTAAGPATCLAGQLPWAPTAFGGRGAVVHVDVYGNLITNIRTAGELVRISGREIPLRRTYGDVPDGALVAYVGSAATIEIAVRNGSAAEQLGVGRGSVVEVT
jgi:S-adenosylmethionine hydrolase